MAIRNSIVWDVTLKHYCECYSSEIHHLTVFQVKKETLLSPEELHLFRNHSSQMAALDFMVSIASNTFIPTYDGNMARLVEGHRRCATSFLAEQLSFSSGCFIRGHRV